MPQIKFHAVGYHFPFFMQKGDRVLSPELVNIEKPHRYKWKIFSAEFALDGFNPRRAKMTKSDRNFLKAIFTIVESGGEVITSYQPRPSNEQKEN